MCTNDPREEAGCDQVDGKDRSYRTTRRRRQEREEHPHVLVHGEPQQKDCANGPPDGEITVQNVAWAAKRSDFLNERALAVSRRDGFKVVA
ncbi:hypothetical protein AaE_010346 [Aphanomyces astaci]|uniref:Uncharacterized protein n=1 Tax=Aphanomyces astaci TaxID=112090 RepID=A0A6A5A192_APHAT|nr:hypothetical protein AaE_010346 [Aphanomyces astaci]